MLGVNKWDPVRLPYIYTTTWLWTGVVDEFLDEIYSAMYNKWVFSNLTWGEQNSYRVSTFLVWMQHREPADVRA